MVSSARPGDSLRVKSLKIGEPGQGGRPLALKLGLLFLSDLTITMSISISITIIVIIISVWQ